MTSLKTSIKTITYLSDIGCLEIQGASLAGSGSGGEHAAVLYSLIGTCRLNNVELEKWLCYGIEHIHDWSANLVRDL